MHQSECSYSRPHKTITLKLGSSYEEIDEGLAPLKVIENRLHWVRDESFGEDRCRVRSGSAPQVLAAIRNLIMRLEHA